MIFKGMSRRHSPAASDLKETASEFDAGYYGWLLEKAWAEAAFVFR